MHILPGENIHLNDNETMIVQKPAEKTYRGSKSSKSSGWYNYLPNETKPMEGNLNSTNATTESFRIQNNGTSYVSSMENISSTFASDSIQREHFMILQAIVKLFSYFYTLFSFTRQC